MFHIAGNKDIKDGKVTDVYFQRALDIMRAKGVDKRVRMELFAKKLPEKWEWGVLAGVEECYYLLKGLDVSVRCMEEGTFFHAGEPVLEIEGMYGEFAAYETALLGLLCQASGVATKAARCKKAAGDKPVFSFGARRMHPALAPMLERNAFAGGCDGVASVVGAELIKEKPVGTIPHALILLMGDTVEAAKAFNEVVPPEVKRVMLIDTFNDEKFETLRVARALGDDLYAVRLDTPGSRRGDMLSILQEVRWELDLAGYSHVKLFVSGGVDEYQIMEYNPAADAYGVGTAICNAPVVNFSMDIVEMEGEPIAKKGKWAGSKQVLRCAECFSSRILPRGMEGAECECGKTMEPLLKPFMEKGELVVKLLEPHEIRKRVLEQLEMVRPIS